MSETDVIPARTLTNVLSNVKNSKGSTLFTNDQINKLSTLKLSNGQPIFTLNIDARGLTYSLLNQVEKYGFDNVYSFLTSKIWNTRNEIFLSSPILENVRQKIRIDNELYRNKSEIVQGALKCKKCGSEETLSAIVQVRGADEPATIFATCIACGNKWRE